MHLHISFSGNIYSLKCLVEEHMTIIGNGKRFEKVKFHSEMEFEEDIVKSSNIIFGENIVFINPKKKLESRSLGGVIPDGFFFDFNDPTDPQFYIVEVELVSHNFFNHVFPQITKFFAFFKNLSVQKSLVDKLFNIIDNDNGLKTEFKKFLGRGEIHKFLSDIVETSQNILLIADGTFIEFQEITDTYTDTWVKLVKFIEICKYTYYDDCVYTIIPDFESIQYVETAINIPDTPTEGVMYTEELHLESVSDQTKDIYQRIKEITFEEDNSLYFNPQKYYISIRSTKNIAYIKIRKKKIRIIIMLPEEYLRNIVNTYTVSTLSQGVQDFYNGPCAAIDIDNLTNEPEIIKLIHELVIFHKDS